MTQHVHSAAITTPPLLDIASVDTELTALFARLKALPDLTLVTEFTRISKDYAGWRQDQVRANSFLNAVRPLEQPAVSAEPDPWDLGDVTPAAAAPAPTLPDPPAPAPVAQRAEPAEEPAPEVPAEVSDESETAEAEDESPVPADTEDTPEQDSPPAVSVPRVEAEAGSLFGQLRALYERGQGSGYRIMGSFLPGGLQRLVFIDEQNGTALKTFELTATDADFDAELAPLLGSYLAEPAHEVRSLSDQVAGAAKAQSAANKKPVTPAKSSPAAKAPARAATQPPARTGQVTLTLDPVVSATGSFDGPSKGKLKFTAGKALMPGLLPGEYLVKVLPDGHLEIEQKVTVAAGDSLTLALHPTSAGLEF